jgi:hypothetical protein
MANRKVLWKKWIDPFDPEDEINLEDENDEEEEEISSYHDSYEEMERKQTQAAEHGPGKPNRSAGPLLVGPMGVIPLNEHNQPSKVFNFWMGHTNFDIGEEEKDIIEVTPGVETLEVYTRYRIRVSIGLAFDEEEVLDEISKRLNPEEPKPEINIKGTGLDRIKKHLGSKYKFWAIFVLPDGQLDYRTGDTQDSVKEKIENYPNKADVLTSWEVNNDANQVNEKRGNGRGVQASPRKQG